MNDAIHAERFRIGNGVYHPSYGEGVVRAYADHTAYLVRFFSHNKLVRVEARALESRPKAGEYVRTHRRH